MKGNISILKQVRLFVYDFDGVMTDNTFILDEKGNEQVSLNRSDGLAIAEIKKRGYKQIIISTENCDIIKLRAKKLGIKCFIGIDDKLLALKEYLSSEMLEFTEIAYVGNDINDLDSLCWVSFPFVSNDSHVILKSKGFTILKTSGGNGVLREIADIFEEL